jgi:hypothetical protein
MSSSEAKHICLLLPRWITCAGIPTGRYLGLLGIDQQNLSHLIALSFPISTLVKCSLTTYLYAIASV